MTTRETRYVVTWMERAPSGGFPLYGREVSADVVAALHLVPGLLASPVVDRISVYVLEDDGDRDERDAPRDPSPAIELMRFDGRWRLWTPRERTGVFT